jgi:hypothetical protein
MLQQKGASVEGDQWVENMMDNRLWCCSGSDGRVKVLSK